ncbi:MULTISPECIES: hypothetical protein [unclassified Streptomyces]|uniref:hypothetical protein n=1 Tax=unclassified Streptomyces TaxID=2593676 RepID=UPI00039A7BD3|nr:MULTISPECIES: hypothetical protein [unclassified Streptomyces]MYT28566.1 hypothetical protein [Streptomyces sp. SID8354]
MATHSIRAKELPRERALAEAAARTLHRRLQRALEVPSKAARIFKDYAVNLYFPANRMSALQRLRCTPPLLLVEYLVYRVDSVTEGAKDVDLDVARNADYDKLHAYKARFESLLRRAHAYNGVVAREIGNGERYVRLENKVTSSRTVDHADVLRLAELRPSDVRLLHGMTFALLGRPADTALLKLLWPVEVLADIGNDLTDYHKDVAGGQFNTYDAFVKLYGPAAPERLRTEIARYEQMFLDELAEFPRARQAELRALGTRRYRPLTAVIPEALPAHPTPAERP